MDSVQVYEGDGVDRGRHGYLIFDNWAVSLPWGGDPSLGIGIIDWQAKQADCKPFLTHEDAAHTIKESRFERRHLTVVQL